MIAAIILAAGPSTRLGRPKQLLPLGGGTLLSHAIDCAAGGGCDPVLVVVGAHAEEVAPEAERRSAKIVRCSAWRQGLSASIRAGVEGLGVHAPEARAAMLLLCDQPRLTPWIVGRLVREYDAQAGRIVACEYGGAPGVPAIFDRSRFEELCHLHGSGGAKSLLLSHAASLVRVAWAEGAVDIDRPEDLPELEPGERPQSGRRQ